MIYAYVYLYKRRPCAGWPVSTKKMSHVLHDFWILGTIFYTDEKFNFLTCTDSNFLSHQFQQQRIVSLINKKIGTYFVNLVVVESSTTMLNSARTYIASPKRSSISPGGPSHSFASRRTWRSPPVSHALWDREVAPTREPAPYSISILVS